MRTLSATLVQSDARPTWGRGFDLHSSVECDHIILSSVILFLPLIQEGILSVSGERICTSIGLPLRGLSLSRKNVCLHHENMPILIMTPLLYSKTGVYRGINYFSYFCSNIDCGYSLEPPRRGGSNEYPRSMFLSRNMKNIRLFI